MPCNCLNMASSSSVHRCPTQTCLCLTKCLPSAVSLCGNDLSCKTSKQCSVHFRFSFVLDLSDLLVQPSFIVTHLSGHLSRGTFACYLTRAIAILFCQRGQACSSSLQTSARSMSSSTSTCVGYMPSTRSSSVV